MAAYSKPVNAARPLASDWRNGGYRGLTELGWKWTSRALQGPVAAARNHRLTEPTDRPPKVQDPLLTLIQSGSGQPRKSASSGLTSPPEKLAPMKSKLLPLPGRGGVAASSRR